MWFESRGVIGGSKTKRASEAIIWLIEINQKESKKSRASRTLLINPSDLLNLIYIISKATHNSCLAISDTKGHHTSKKEM